MGVQFQWAPSRLINRAPSNQVITCKSSKLLVGSIVGSEGDTTTTVIGYTVCFKLLTGHWDNVVFPLLVAISSPRAYSVGSMTWLSVVMMLTMVVTMRTTVTMVMIMMIVIDGGDEDIKVSMERRRR